ncbi:methyltransferase domain-containing protein [Nocardiopsis suaedae]|uniref:Protein-L-isoaspartate O-methyltransferase n=1 Tax=Nocardiopsis suaedae TaxID=3018444 RepID=A0ABT4TPS2_9ACTN|nr:methyltransferase domain-containing protein [Nocardiopsis suaedae]MDA2806685.1 methyltransferase domain-containing protein [Nocardiopsis suaedae]
MPPVPASEELISMLLEAGALTPEWAPAFKELPRSAFLPEKMWAFDTRTGQSSLVDRTASPESWTYWATADAPITVQWDDGAYGSPRHGTVPTSSASMPSVVASMLRDLDAHPGMTVLELGTGTGWNAALLAHRLGPHAVTSIEADPEIARAARDNLRRVGGDVHVVAGDGLLGAPDRAPFDRVIATFGLRTVPATWVTQTRPGGILLVPWGTDFSPQDAVARLVVAEDGLSASGRFTGPVQFMKARSQRLAWPGGDRHVHDWPGRTSTTSLTADDIAPKDPYGSPAFVLGLLVDEAVHVRHDDEHRTVVWVYGLSDRSWAAAVFDGDTGTGRVHQSGPRSLWDDVEAAWTWWERQGRPGVEEFGLTVTADGAQQAWLRAPDRLLPRRSA